MEFEHDGTWFEYTVETLRNNKTVISVNSTSEYIGSVIFAHALESAMGKIGEFSAHLNYHEMRQLNHEEVARWIVANNL